MSNPAFKPSLKLLDATMIVAGSMIGSGIFIVSADITRNVGSAGWLIAVWLITGFMTLTAAISYGELSAMFPKAGGQYVYLKESYNPLIGFLYGWSFFAVIQTGTIAAVGVAFSKFAGYFFHDLEIKDENILMNFGWLKIYPAQLVSIALIAFLTYTNTKGVKGGKWIQNIFTTTKVLSLLGLIVAGFIFFKPEVWNSNWSNAWEIKNLSADGAITAVIGAGVFGAIAASMVVALLVSLLMWQSDRRTLQASINESKNETLAAVKENTEIKESLSKQSASGEELAQINAILASPNQYQMLTLKATENAPQTMSSASGTVYWNKRDKKWVVTADLPPPPEGKAYQLWFVTSDSPVSAGMITPDETGHGFLVTDVPSSIQTVVAAAITLEPLGGSLQPTMPIIAMGKAA